MIAVGHLDLKQLKSVSRKVSNGTSTDDNLPCSKDGVKFFVHKPFLTLTSEWTPARPPYGNLFTTPHLAHRAAHQRPNPPR